MNAYYPYEVVKENPLSLELASKNILRQIILLRLIPFLLFPVFYGGLIYLPIVISPIVHMVLFIMLIRFLIFFFIEPIITHVEVTNDEILIKRAAILLGREEELPIAKAHQINFVTANGFNKNLVLFNLKMKSKRNWRFLSIANPTDEDLRTVIVQLEDITGLEVVNKNRKSKKQLINKS